MHQVYFFMWFIVIFRLLVMYSNLFLDSPRGLKFMKPNNGRMSDDLLTILAVTMYDILLGVAWFFDFNEIESHRFRYTNQIRYRVLYSRHIILTYRHGTKRKKVFSIYFVLQIFGIFGWCTDIRSDQIVFFNYGPGGVERQTVNWW